MIRYLVISILAFALAVAVGIKAFSADPYEHRPNLIPPACRVIRITPYPPIPIKVPEVREIYSPSKDFDFWTIVTREEIYLLPGKTELHFEMERRGRD